MNIIIQSFAALGWHLLLHSSSTTEGFVGVRRGAVTPTQPVEHRTGATGNHCCVTKSSLWLATSSSINSNLGNETEQWLSMLKDETRTQMNDPDQVFGGKPFKWNDKSWTPFISEVAVYLRLESETQEDIVDTMAGLLRYRVKNQEKLVVAAGTPPDGELFNRKLRVEGVPSAMCDKLFENYVANTKETGMLALFDASV